MNYSDPAFLIACQRLEVDPQEFHYKNQIVEKRKEMMEKLLRKEYEAVKRYEQAQPVSPKAAEQQTFLTEASGLAVAQIPQVEPETKLQYEVLVTTGPWDIEANERILRDSTKTSNRQVFRRVARVLRPSVLVPATLQMQIGKKAVPGLEASMISRDLCHNPSKEEKYEKVRQNFHQHKALTQLQKEMDLKIRTQHREHAHARNTNAEIGYRSNAQIIALEKVREAQFNKEVHELNKAIAVEQDLQAREPQYSYTPRTRNRVFHDDLFVKQQNKLKQ
ncbi:Hypothetical_protein [Hexamita inflata]|uniref:Hypothetical_protein n=1 Tax=Hexamita inflata TaxID=28002 RepID=A0AA86NA15_9EUKA|nr:Hypothetical protein HINF_LOCUS3036 [Hexamita inflata]